MTDTDLSSNELPERKVGRILLRFESRFCTKESSSSVPDFTILFAIEDTATWFIKFRGGSVIVNNRENIFAAAPDTRNMISFKSHRDFINSLALNYSLQDCTNKVAARIDGSEQAAAYFWENLNACRSTGRSAVSDGSSSSREIVSSSPAPPPVQSPLRSFETKRPSMTGLNFQRVGKPFLLRPQATSATPFREVIKCGTLLKKRDILTGWQSRFFVLQSGRVEHYTDQNDYQSGGKVRGAVDLIGGEVHGPKPCTVNGSEHWSITVEPKYRHRTFKVASEGIGMQGKEEIENWEKYFRQAVSATVPATPLTGTGRVSSNGNLAGIASGGSASNSATGTSYTRGGNISMAGESPDGTPLGGVGGGGGFFDRPLWMNRTSSFDVPITTGTATIASPDTTLAGRMDRVAMSEKIQMSGDHNHNHNSHRDMILVGGGGIAMGAGRGMSASGRRPHAASISGPLMGAGGAGGAGAGVSSECSPDMISSSSERRSRSATEELSTVRNSSSDALRSSVVADGSGRIGAGGAASSSSSSSSSSGGGRGGGSPHRTTGAGASAASSILDAIRDTDYISGVFSEFLEAALGSLPLPPSTGGGYFSSSNIGFAVVAIVAIVAGYFSIGVWGSVWTVTLIVLIGQIIPPPINRDRDRDARNLTGGPSSSSAKSSASPDAVHMAVARDALPTTAIALSRMALNEASADDGDGVNDNRLIN